MDVVRPVNITHNTAAALQRYAGFLNEFRQWDATFENVRGTYPSQQFAAGFDSLTTRYEAALKRDMKGSAGILGGFSDHARTKLWHEYAYGPSSMRMSINSMAKYKVPFGSGTDRRSWPTELDRTIEQLIVGVQLLASAVHRNPAPVPHPGPNPYPNPTPNPYPNPYPAPEPNPVPFPTPDPVPFPTPDPVPFPDPAPYPGDEYGA